MPNQNPTQQTNHKDPLATQTPRSPHQQQSRRPKGHLPTREAHTRHREPTSERAAGLTPATITRPPGSPDEEPESTRGGARGIPQVLEGWSKIQVSRLHDERSRATIEHDRVVNDRGAVRSRCEALCPESSPIKLLNSTLAFVLHAKKNLEYSSKQKHACGGCRTRADLFVLGVINLYSSGTRRGHTHTQEELAPKLRSPPLSQPTTQSHCMERSVKGG